MALPDPYGVDVDFDIIPPGLEACAICGWLPSSGLEHHSFHMGFLAGRAPPRVICWEVVP